MTGLENRDFTAPDETRTPDKTTVEVVNIGRRPDRALHLPARLEVVGVHQARRRDRQLPGRAHRLRGLGHAARQARRRHRGRGTPGDVYRIAPGHDAWVVGDEPAVFVEFQGAANYAKG